MRQALGLTIHYSAPELSRLIEVANKVCKQDGKKPELVALRLFSNS